LVVRRVSLCLSEQVQIFQSTNVPQPKSLGHGVGVVIPLAIRSDTYGSSLGLAVAWGSVMTLDFIVVAMTLVKTIRLNRRGGGRHTIIYILMRDVRNIP
jgi:hypothetical protein